MAKNKSHQNAMSKVDPCQIDLLTILHGCDGKTLWLTDENLTGFATMAAKSERSITAVTNRFDVQQSLLEAGIDTHFNDFDLSGLPLNHYDHIVYRISKEKAVIHRILNQVSSLLKSDGKLYLIGQKNDGLKRFSTNAEAFFGASQTKKNGTVYTTILSQPLHQTDTRLDDDDYTELRKIADSQPFGAEPGALKIVSKPGTFGWDKIDQGSEFLIEQLPTLLSAQKRITASDTWPASMLDLGCGYGYLTLMTASLPIQQRIATDNNAAALLAMARNAQENSLEVTVTASNCAQGIAQRVDLILCNPPFHQGFQTNGQLTDLFLLQTKKHLNTKGLAVFVVNAFIPLEKKAKAQFGKVEAVANNGKFKVVALSP